MPEEQSWKFWRPLSFWTVILIFFATTVTCQLLFVALREGLGLPVGASLASGLGGGLGAAITFWLANKKRAKESQPKE